MVQEKIPVYYYWSEEYEIYARILQWGLSHYTDTFEDRGIFREQKEFDKVCYTKPGEPYFNHCFFKVEKAYELLQTLPENSYFLFSDADVIVFPGKPLKELFDVYMKLEADLVFMRDAPRLNVSNCGFIFMRVNQRNRDFWKSILETHAQREGCEQSIINSLLKTYGGSHFYFPHELIATTCTLKEGEENPNSVGEMRRRCMVFQALCDPTKSKASVREQKLVQYQALGIPVRI